MRAAPALRYLDGEALARVPHLMVDSYAFGSACLLELSHWPGNKTPLAYRRDTSTEAVLAWLEDDNAAVPISALAAASVDHFDIDGLLALWSALNPDEALRSGRLLTASAETEDFDRFQDETALAATLSLLSRERRAAAAVVDAKVSTTAAFTRALYEALLPEVAQILADPWRLQPHWDAEFRDVMRSRAVLEAKTADAHLEEWPDVDLAVVISGERLHPYAVHAATERTRILLLTPGHRPQLSYRYESFVDLVSRQTAPRLPLKPLGASLNEKEVGGVWIADGMLTAHPKVQLFANDGGIAPSSLPIPTLIDTVRGYFCAMGATPGAAWRPSQGLGEEAGHLLELDLTPPSMSVRAERPDDQASATAGSLGCYDALLAASVTELSVGDEDILVVSDGTSLRALPKVCPHRGGPLKDALFTPGRAICRWHGSEFDLASGAVLAGPAQCPLEIRSVLNVDGQAYISLAK
jgi:nitrite reductase/ring-hydroxylating ferredoxin subunit